MKKITISAVDVQMGDVVRMAYEGMDYNLTVVGIVHRTNFAEVHIIANDEENRAQLSRTVPFIQKIEVYRK